MKKMKKMIETVIGMAVLLALSGGCAHTSQSGEQSNIDFESLDTDTQVVASQVETNVDSR